MNLRPNDASCFGKKVLQATSTVEAFEQTRHRCRVRRYVQSVLNPNLRVFGELTIRSDNQRLKPNRFTGHLPRNASTFFRSSAAFGSSEELECKKAETIQG